jgi:hypothetical protein
MESYNCFELELADNSHSKNKTFQVCHIISTDFNYRCEMTLILIENSSFVSTLMRQSQLSRTSIINTDLRRSSFQYVSFASDVDIQMSNFSDSQFDICNFDKPHITDTFFDSCEFKDVEYNDNSMILNSSFQNVSYVRTDIIAPSTQIQNDWPQVVRLITDSVISSRTQTVNAFVSRRRPLVSRVYVDSRDEDYVSNESLHMSYMPSEIPPQIFRTRIQNPNTSFDITNIAIPLNQVAMDVIDGEILLFDHMRQNPDSLVFLFNDEYFIATRNTILQMISDSTVEEKLNNSIVYECIEFDTLRSENIVTQGPLVKLASLGLPTNRVYIPINELRIVLDDKRQYLYQIIDTKEKVKSVVSYQILYNLTDRDGASHCQEGQNGAIFKLL